MTHKGYTLDDVESLANDISNINVFVMSGSVSNREVIFPVMDELQSKIEQLQSAISYVRLAPSVLAEQQSKSKIDVSNH